jgi:hypothetical protein
MSRFAKIVFALTGLLSLPFSFPPNPLTMYTIFVLAYFLRERLNLRFQLWRFMLVVMASSLLLEFLAWLSNYLEANPNPALFHPQLIPDLLIAIGFYSGWAIAWGFILQRYRFSLPEVFVLQGIYGVAFEQNGAILLLGFAQFPLGLIFWLYVFLTYGATMALAFLPFRDSFAEKNSSRWKYLWLLLLMIILTHLMTLIFGLLWMALGLIPEAGSIVERPFF